MILLVVTKTTLWLLHQNNTWVTLSVCVCEITGYQIQGELIPLDLIHVFWKKLFIKEHKVTEEESGKSWI